MSQENVEEAFGNAESLRGTRLVPQTVSERASLRRTFGEQLRVRFPGPFRRLGAILQRLPPRSRIRRALTVHLIVRAYAAANRRDFELILTSNDPALYEYRPSADLLPPDMDTVYRGHEGYREFWRLWLEAFEDIRWDPEEILDLGDKALVTTKQSGTGSGSGVAVDEPVYQLFTFRRGLVIRQEDFLDRSQALEAAGLSELT
jgi:ketosteroid isomerase-like protein